jgi:hypothetical protein
MLLSTFKRLLRNYYLEALHSYMMQKIQKRGNLCVKTLVVV